MKIKADREVCIGAGMCALTLSALFDQDDEEGLVVVLEPEPAAEHRTAVRRAIQSCPSGALSLTE
ncbi:ferredoxin [Sinosporangium siamense]|uniref:Ferredoxin n=1 Tax=Sinosporangium siamense TaxID=1367973 RepID=A0A919RPL7_9ACTN|nr:(4Fe-4S)-binding protein [Sinosporangium siamense]GII96314.1 ferredoxin [Sinosporangium siamense]